MIDADLSTTPVDHLPIALRAYAEPAASEKKGAGRVQRPSEWVLIVRRQMI
ncbi:hypothetical protein [Methylobacterium durans]|uniref:hypothetical protein n=1 Tax=Methylobacterium durans TaxID=2202825 RepID=UPI0013A53022|nr:hypothetical protein [Methylobacterium durans]